MKIGPRLELDLTDPWSVSLVDQYVMSHARALLVEPRPDRSNSLDLNTTYRKQHPDVNLSGVEEFWRFIMLELAAVIMETGANIYRRDIESHFEYLLDLWLENNLVNFTRSFWPPGTRPPTKIVIKNKILAQHRSPHLALEPHDAVASAS